MPTVKRFENLLLKHGSDAIYHREETGEACPCRTPEGYRDPIWHLANPNAPECNEAGFLITDPTHLPVKAFIQPIQSTRATRLSTEYLVQMFGEIEADDHLGVFPYSWGGVTLNFSDWGTSGEDWVLFDSRYYMVVNGNKMADADGGAVNHHWEVGLRLMRPPMSQLVSVIAADAGTGGGG
jgi:hypothetical protein